MAEPSKVPETTEANQSDEFSADAASSIVHLKIKGNNAFIDLDVTQYEDSLKPMVIYFQNSPIYQAITLHPEVSITVLSYAYSSAVYDSAKDEIRFFLASNTKQKIVNIK